MSKRKTYDCDVLVSVFRPVMRNFIAAQIRAIRPETRVQFANIEFKTSTDFHDAAQCRALPRVVVIEDPHSVIGNGGSSSADQNLRPDCRWLVLSDSGNLGIARRAENLRSVSSDDEPSDFRTAIDWAMQALRWPPAQASNSDGAATTSPAGGQTRTGMLSARQKQIMSLIATGCSNKQIAAQLDIREGTVKAHLFSIYRCYGVRNRTQATLQYLADVKAESDN